jgi:hypothetical protein
MLFDLTHSLYMIISVLLSVGVFFAAARFCKAGESKELFLKWVAVITVVLHYSNIWVQYFGNGGSTDGLEGSHLLPIYPCHIMMWLLFITAFKKKKSGVLFTMLAEFCFWGGIICGSIGIILNENYASMPTLADWGVFKGLLSHSTLIIGCIYMRVGGFMKIRVFNVLSVAAGLCVFLADGIFANWLYKVCGLPAVNAMYLQHSPYPSTPWLSPILMGVVGCLVLFAILVVYEQRFPEEERWYNKAKEKIRRFKDI